MIVLKTNYNFWKKIFYIIIISLSISPAFATSDVDNRNYLLIACMSIGPILFLSIGTIKWKTDGLVLLLISLIFITQILFNPQSVRWTSIFFSCMFFIYFLTAIKVVKKARINYSTLCNITKYIIYAYAIVLIIQQICVLTGLPIFNHIGVAESKWKLNALSAEPSHTSRYVGILMYSFLHFKDKIVGYRIPFKECFRKNQKIWMAFLWVILTTVSGTAMIVLALILSRYLTKKNLILACTFLGIAFMVGVKSDMTALRRSTSFLTAVMTGDTKLMMATDHSASVRVVPAILCIERIEPLSLRGWVGEGGGSTATWMSNYMPGVPKGWSGGAMASYALEYGLLVSLLFIGLSFNWCYDKNNKLCTIGLWLICVVLIGVNSQIAWLCILMLYLDKNLSVRNENKSILQFT